jgi:DNA adenine methylase
MTQTLLLPEFVDKRADVARAVNVSSVPHHSPFRYPGGKTWLVPYFRRWVKSLGKKPQCLIEPFAGGGIISLTAVFEYLVDRALMVEMDEQIAAVWQAVVDGNSEWLAKRILSFDLTRENVIAQLQTKPASTKEIAFQTILKNRTLHGGILAEGSRFIRNGERGKGISSRWYPRTLAKRMTNLSLVANKIEFQHGDGMDVLTANADKKNAIFFIDPPYTAGGKRAGTRLYTHFELDHERLFRICKGLAGDFLMTYDNAEEVKELARKHGFEMKPVAMKNTHHAQMTELLIGRNLDWLAESPRVYETASKYHVKRNSQHRKKRSAGR